MVLVCGLFELLRLTINSIEEIFSLKSELQLLRYMNEQTMEICTCVSQNEINDQNKAISEPEIEMLKVLLELKMDIAVLKEIVLNHFKTKEKSKEEHSIKSSYGIGTFSFLNESYEIMDSVLFDSYKIENDIAESVADPDRIQIIEKIPSDDSDYPEEEDIVVIMANYNY